MMLPGGLHAAETDQRVTPGLLRGQAAADIIFHGEAKVRGKLLVEVAIQLAFSEEGRYVRE
jgi:hypothetical protein